MQSMQTAKILLVDDRSENLLALESLLESPGVETVTATSGNEALTHMLGHDFALVLLDVQMPDMDGFETAEFMRSRDTTKDVPIIFVSAVNQDHNYIFKGYEQGAVDYMFKPLDEYILKSKVQIFLNLYRQKKAYEQTTLELSRAVDELQKANKTIVEQQKSVIEEERLKLLLQMAGATAHEMNQPLTALLGGIDLINLHLQDPEKLPDDLRLVKDAGKRIENIVRKIQNVRRVETVPYVSNNSIINFDQKIKILSVEDSPEFFELLNRIIKKNPGMQAYNAPDCAAARRMIEEEDYDLILLDHVLPDGNAFDVMEALRQNNSPTPVIVITGHADEVTASQAIQAGAADYLNKKEVTGESLHQSINNILEKQRLQMEIRAAMGKMAEMATTDELTKLYNRRYCTEALERDIARTSRYGGELTVCLIDLDNFKKINDSYGHAAGDVVLTEVAKLLTKNMRTADCLGRYGGEEFLAILPNTNCDSTALVCERFRKAVANHAFAFNEVHFQITVSIGIAQMEDNRLSMTDLINRADQALYKAKEAGRNRIEVYT